MTDGYPDDAEEYPEGVDEEFLARLNSIEAAEERVDELREEVTRLNDLPLDEDDTQRLLWARLSGWSLTDIRGAFEAVDDLRTAPSRELTIRLLAQLGQMTQDETEELLDEIEALARKYDD